MIKKISKLKLGANIVYEGIYDRSYRTFKKTQIHFIFEAMVPELGIEHDTVEFKQIKESTVNLKTIFSLFNCFRITKYSVFPAKLFINFGFICSFFSF